MKIYINEKEIETDKKFITKWDFMKLAGVASLCPEHEKYNFAIEKSDKYWEDEYIESDMFELTEGMRYKFFPKASSSNYGPFM